MRWFERRFRLEANGTTLRREILGGVTTFLTMAYIIFVQPLVLGAAGMEVGAVMTATCLASALACVVMAFLANYPIALAPGMGTNVFFAYTVVLTMGFTWQQALGAVFFSGVLFLLLTFVGVREAIIQAIPANLRSAVAVGIGFLISVVGLEWAGLVVDHPATLVTLGDLAAAPTLLSLLGLAVTAACLALGWRAAILAGIGVNLVVGILAGLVPFAGVVGSAPSLAPTWLQLDFSALLTPELLPVVFVFFFLDLFDTVGTLTGVTQEAGLMQPDGTLPRARQALTADALGTIFGSMLGTSTVTSYVESAAGIATGARTGLANLVTAALFLGALFFSPLLKAVGGGVAWGESTLYPVIAPALIVVGCLLASSIRRIEWQTPDEAIPAFLTILMMPLTFSITEGLAFGFISYTMLKLVQGRIREVPPLISVCAGLFLLRYVFL